MAIEDERAATKGDLAKVETRIDVVGRRIDEVERRLVERIDGVEPRLTQKMDSLEVNFNRNMDEKLGAMETRLLTAFEKWAVPMNGRVRKLEVSEGVTEERLAIIEKRNPPAA